MIKAVVFDLDDTLYPEYDYVKSGFRAVAAEWERVCAVSDTYDELLRLFDEDKKNVFDRYAASHSDKSAPSVEGMVQIYREHVPCLSLADDVQQTLSNLRTKGYKLGIITDGNPARQRMKISALGLTETVDKIIVTDELGGKAFRKPNPKAFELMATALSVLPEELVYVGDNPLKDFAVKKYLPIQTVRLLVKEGMYAKESFSDGIESDITVRSLRELCVVL